MWQYAQKEGTIQQALLLYHSVPPTSNTYKHHCNWMDIIRRTVWLRADKESSNMPSTTALKLHWLRCLWVLSMWRGAVENDFDLPGKPTCTCACAHTQTHTCIIIHVYTHEHINHLPSCCTHIGLCEFGWQRTNGALVVVWDTPEAQQVVKKRLDFVLSGCGCKTGCNTRRCKCYRQQQGCGPGCRCVGCINPHKISATQQDDSPEQDKMDVDSMQTHRVIGIFV